MEVFAVEKKAKKGVIIAAAVLLIVVGAFWAKGYYHDRYVASNLYYTQIPTDEVNEDSWLVDADGVKQEKGKAYDLIGYDETGCAKEVYFTKAGGAADLYAPGTYLIVSTSKTIVVGVKAVEEADIPQTALEQIQKLGTRPQ